MVHSVEGLVSISDLARLEGVDKASISRRVKKYVNAGKIRPRQGSNRSKLISLEEWHSAARGSTGPTHTQPLDSIDLLPRPPKTDPQWPQYLLAARACRNQYLMATQGEELSLEIVTRIQDYVGDRGFSLFKAAIVNGAPVHPANRRMMFSLLRDLAICCGLIAAPGVTDAIPAKKPGEEFVEELVRIIDGARRPLNDTQLRNALQERMGCYVSAASFTAAKQKAVRRCAGVD